MGGSTSSKSEVESFRRSRSALLDKGFAALERDFEAEARRTAQSLSSSDSELQLESPEHSPQHALEGLMEVKLIRMDGTSIPLKVSPATTCDDVISMLHRRGCVPNGCPCLLFDSHLLEGSVTLCNAGVSNGSELQLVLSRPSLSLCANDNNLGPMGLHALVEGLRSLRKASLMRTGLFGKAGGQAVARLLRASPGLESLELNGNSGFGAASLGATGIDLKSMAVDMRPAYNLRHVALADCGLEGAWGGQQLAALLVKAPSLLSLDVHSNNNLGSSGLLALARVLRRPLSLTSLSVEDLGLEDAEGGEAAGALVERMPCLRSLEVSNNLLGSGLRLLAESLRDHDLGRLGARNVGLAKELSWADCETFQLLARHPELHVDTEGHIFQGPAEVMEMLWRMQLLEEGQGTLPGQELCEDSVQDLLQQVEEPGLPHLSLSQAEHLEALLLRSLPNLRSLDLGDCGLQASAGQLLAQLLLNCPQLRSLVLAKNHHLENAGIEMLGKNLVAHSLSHLDLSCCSIAGAEGSDAILSVLQSLPDLQSLLLSSNPGLGENIGPLLASILQTRIAVLSLASCGISMLELNFAGKTCLDSLDLGGNTIGPWGLRRLACQFPQLNLQQLDLADCGLESQAGGEAIAVLLAKCETP